MPPNKEIEKPETAPPSSVEKSDIDTIASQSAQGGEARASKPNPDALQDFEATGLFDTKNVKFDPNIHAAGKDGKPIHNNDGTFRKRPGRKNNDGAQSRVYNSKTTREAESADAAQGERARTQAIMAVTVSTNFATLVMGPHWKPTDEERAMLEDTTGAAFQSWGMDDLPPGWALLGAVAMYAAPRLVVEKQKGSFSGMLGAIKAKFNGGDKKEKDKKKETSAETLEKGKSVA